MTIIKIVNNVPYHYETIESVISYYNKIFKIDKSDKDVIYLDIRNNNEYLTYITNKYPKIIINKNIDTYDFYINCTIYPNDFDKIKNMNPKKYYYICHQVDAKMIYMPNVFYLTPLCKTNRYINCDILPYQSNKNINKNIPIYVIQGNITEGRRNYKLLHNILSFKTNYKYKIKIVGRGNLDKSFDKYKNKLIIKNNLNFIDYHKEFLDCYCIIPLITKKSHSQYYTTKLTSTVNYANAYNLRVLTDKDLQSIYKFKNAVVFDNENDIHIGFKKTLDKFYKHIKTNPNININQNQISNTT